MSKDTKNDYSLLDLLNAVIYMAVDGINREVISDLLFGDLSEGIRLVADRAVRDVLERPNTTHSVDLDDFCSINEISQGLIRDGFGEVLSSNFGLAGNTVVSLIRSMNTERGRLLLGNMFVDRKIAILTLKYGKQYIVCRELRYEQGSCETIKLVGLLYDVAYLVASVLFMAIAAYEIGRMSPDQVNIIASLLRDLALDVGIELHDIAGLDIGADGPCDISIFMSEDDRSLVEEGLGGWLN